jgi:hypothetical protein
MVTEPLKWYDENADNPPWVKALAEVLLRAVQQLAVLGVVFLFLRWRGNEVNRGR